jgi:maleamate amidohydrolase
MAYVPDIIPAEERARHAKGNIDTVVVTGMVTSGCVRATVIDAFSHNYRVVVPIECVADRSATSHQVNLFDMDMKYADVLPLADVLTHFGRR